MEAELSYMSYAEIAQSVKSTQLELAYERSLREAERIYEEERVRALNVQLLLFEDENDSLQEHAAQNEDHQASLEETNEELRVHVSEVEAELRQTQMDLRARQRDLDHLKAEVHALNAASADATKILSEKLALARELNTLKPELEHLKSQTCTHQKLLSEKLALQRELSSIQVELETEKRTVQRIKTQEKASAREESALTTEIEELKKELAKSHREAQKSDRENRKRAAEWEAEKEVLEGKLDAFRNKLRSTKDQLTEAHEEIEKLQASQMAQSAEMTKARLSGATVANSKKRNVARFDPDMTIGTPGQRGPVAKKQRVSVNVGDKSTFSITPFLNRTLSILPESPGGEEVEPQKKVVKKGKQQRDEAVGDADADAAAAPKVKAIKSKLEKPSIAKKSTAVATKTKTSQPLKESTPSKANTVVTKPPLSKLVEEGSNMESDRDDAGAHVNENDDKETTGQTENTETANQDTTEPAKRTSIFDDAPASKVRGLGRGAASVMGRINLKAKPVGKGKPLTEFSPLKKDRRTASILE
ncbi:uncharacterized protein Z518_07358 [Rhinocladiella mackenziei CBS 650.93]|uniref:Uncharacterized protein n=1 Tax=Rhinocladiella mackenziei CBS 650.93 TaxID=1442369 RepID=A0A0D2J467_9EURO|nr:uncharacterized protein Z518_07358 [Rhinocladiella mackenziei CBS 650.93]KIX03805.1 hypothetical protein Z518_07358 [Rhinocladiella mackenziei CBS 650.93]